jgi:type I restriction enzyme S subunit
MKSVRLADVAMINPRRGVVPFPDDNLVSFVPMDAVDNTLGIIVSASSKPYGQVKKGYTAFVENDVIFAKVSPCMQNGKHAIARGLQNSCGFGSTEFHVIRPGPEVLSEWIHYFLRQERTLDAATKTFNGAVGLQRVPPAFLENLYIPLPELDAQRRIVAGLKAQLAAVEDTRQAAISQIEDITHLANAIIRESLSHSNSRVQWLGNVLDEVKQGIGASWAEFPVLGATRDGLAPAKEPVGKKPERYKPVQVGTVFYNPMRILIGSIAMVDMCDAPGITSPDYVALRGREGVVDSRWFYYWLRSPEGERCIASLARGAVRERMLFNRLAEGAIKLPPYRVQQSASQALSELRPMRQSIEAQLRDIELLPSRLLARIFNSIEDTPDARPVH